jgi:DNA-binding beta-propeller fold protein YncE
MKLRIGPPLATVAGLALAATTVAGPASASQRPVTRAASSATTATQVPLWVMHQYVTRAGFNLKVTASPDGSAVFVAGAILKVNHKGTNASVTALDPTTGATLWRTQYTASPNSGFSHIAVSPDGSTVFAAAGAEPVGGGASNALIVAFSAVTGAILWTAGAGFVAPVDGLAVAPDGSAVFTTGAAGTVAYDAATGATLWTAAGGNSITAAPDGSTVYVASTTSVPVQRTAFLTSAYNAATGAAMWQSRFNVPKGSSGPDAIAASPDGAAVFVTGGTSTNGLQSHVGTVAYKAATGTRLWARVLTTPGVSFGIATSPDGSTVYVLNSANPPNGGSTFATEAYAATNGAIRWTARYQGPVTGSFTLPADLAVSPDGARVYVTGNSPAPSGQVQFATVAYDAATGAAAWVARYGHGTQNSAGEGVAVSPDSSKVYVTGDTARFGTTIGYGA